MNEKYVVQSLELHMFFSRIMKEHSIFLEAGFTPVGANYSKTANKYKEHFEAVLRNAVALGNGIISPGVMASGELVTQYTLGSEEKTQNFTGIQIDQGITKMELNLHGNTSPQITHTLEQQVRDLNAEIHTLLDGLIEFKTQVADEVLSCHMFTANYPTLLHHVLHEAQMYKTGIDALEAGKDPNDGIRESELFWDHIMLEHAVFIRGLLDPSESELINTANNFATEYSKLMETAPDTIGETLQETKKFHDFKEAGVKGINECKIRSVILPLMADHVLREANHFIRMLKGK